MRPLKNRVIIKPYQSEDKVGSLWVSTNRVEHPWGEVVAVGPLCAHVRVGDQVAVNLNWRQEFTYDGQAYTVLNEPDVMGIYRA